MKIIRINLYYILVVWLVVLVLVGSVLYMGYLRNIRDLRQLMLNEAERLADIVNVATAVGIDALENIEYLTANRLYDNARYIDRLFGGGVPDRGELETLVREHELYAVDILDSGGNTVLTAGAVDDSADAFLKTYAREINNVLTGVSWGELIGFDRKRHETGRFKGMVLPRTGGGAVIMKTNIDRIFQGRQTFGLGTLGTLFNGISRDEGIKYIVLQDTLGIVVASPNIHEMTRLRSDPFLVKAYNTGSGHRILEVDGENILEVVSSLVTDERDFGILRIGLTTEAIEDIRNSAFRHFIILFTVALVSGAFAFLYVIQRQNYMLLNDEHDRILREVKVMEEESRRAERLASMGYLAAGVAHEIRNPLNSISLIVQQIREEIGDSDDEHRNMLSTVGSEIIRISGIIEHFLRFAKPPALSMARTSLEGIVMDVVDVVSIHAVVRNIEIRTDINSEATCTCDIDQIKQALVNIVLNAIDAIGDDGVVTIGAGTNSNGVVFTVEDTGGGIDTDIMPKIFDPYFTTRDEGTGLGLSEVHRIVTSHGGAIHAINTDAGGALFTIQLPGRAM